MLRIKHARLQRGWNQTALAYHSGLSAADVSRIETGRLKPYTTQAERLAHALGVSVEQLLAEVAPNSGECDLVGAA